MLLSALGSGGLKGGAGWVVGPHWPTPLSLAAVGREMGPGSAEELGLGPEVLPEPLRAIQSYRAKKRARESQVQNSWEGTFWVWKHQDRNWGWDCQVDQEREAKEGGRSDPQSQITHHRPGNSAPGPNQGPPWLPQKWRNSLNSENHQKIPPTAHGKDHMMTWPRFRWVSSEEHHREKGAGAGCGREAVRVGSLGEPQGSIHSTRQSGGPLEQEYPAWGPRDNS